MLERMEKIEKPEAEDCHIFTGSIDPEVPGPKWVLQAEKLKIGYEKDKPLTGEMSLRIRRGQKIAVIGPNGAGKTTFLKTAAGLLPALAGRFEMGQNVFPAYFDQHSGQIDSEDSVLDHFKKHFPALTEKDARHELAAYLFRGKDVCKQVKDLSGGEKARLVMAELLNERPNLMLLDEPTNHMDIAAKETLESAFKAYTGTLLFVSHDRYFIDKFATRIWELRDGHITDFRGGYKEFSAWRERQTLVTQLEKQKEKEQPKEKKPKPERPKNNDKAIARLEREIQRQEEKIAELDKLAEQYATDYQKLMEIQAEKEELDSGLMELYERWEELNA